MTKDIYFIIAIIVAIPLTACTQQAVHNSTEENPEPVSLIPSALLTIDTDKGVYHSNDLMNIRVEAYGDGVFEGKLKVYGIKSGSYRLSQEQAVSVVEGINTFNIEYNTPKCTGCAGIRPGMYDITADLIYNNETIASATTSVDIQQ